jgi:hypothetical protein
VDQAAALGPEALELEDELLQRHRRASPTTSRDHARRAQVALEVRADQVAVEASSGCIGRSPRRLRAPSGGFEKMRPSNARTSTGSSGPDAGRTRRTRSPARPGGSEARPRKRRRAARAAVERRIEPVQPQQPGLEVAPRSAGLVPASVACTTREREAVDLLLGLALRAEGVEQLRAARQEERGVEAALAGAERGAQELGLAQAQEVRSLRP